MRLVHPAKVRGCVVAPGSKSEAQRALLAALLAEGVSRIRGVTWSADVEACRVVAERLGAQVTVEGATAAVRGCGGVPAELRRLEDTELSIYCGESGLCLRMVCAISALGSRPVMITGASTLCARPIGMIEAPLSGLGVRVQCENGYPPIRIQGPLSCADHAVEVDGSLSSQFLSGLLFSLPLAPFDCKLKVRNLASVPYVALTVHMLERFGVEFESHNDYRNFAIRGNQRLRAHDIGIEGDWSGAAFLCVAGAIAGDVTVQNVSFRSLQSDKEILRALQSAGASLEVTDSSVRVSAAALHSFSFDARDCPDLFPPLVALASSCEGTSVIRGSSRLIHKESNRAHALVEEFSKLGIAISESDDTIRVTGGNLRSGKVDSHGDHRIAMACAVAALRADGPVEITDAHVVAKSYPEFFADIEAISS